MITPGFLKETFFTLEDLLEDGNNLIILFCLLEDISKGVIFFFSDVLLNDIVADLIGVCYLKIFIDELFGIKLS